MCSKCDSTYPSVNKRYDLCQTCNRKRLHPNEVKVAYKWKQVTTKVSGKPINFKSKSLKEKEKIYSKLAKQFKLDHPICQADCTNPTSDVHHKKGRGRYLNETKFFLSVCRKCHDRIELNPAWAKSMGYSLSRLSKD